MQVKLREVLKEELTKSKMKKQAETSLRLLWITMLIMSVLYSLLGLAVKTGIFIDLGLDFNQYSVYLYIGSWVVLIVMWIYLLVEWRIGI